MTEKSTHDLIDKAARRMAQDIISGDMTANERVKAFQTLIAYRNAIAEEVEAAEPAPAVESFDRMAERIRAVNGAPNEPAD